jgi:hypothetical protein
LPVPELEEAVAITIQVHLEAQVAQVEETLVPRVRALEPEKAVIMAINQQEALEVRHAEVLLPAMMVLH